MDDKMLTVSIRMVICGLWKDSRIARLAENEEILKFPNFDDYFVPDFYIYDLLDFKLSHFGEKNSLGEENKRKSVIFKIIYKNQSFFQNFSMYLISGGFLMFDPTVWLVLAASGT